MRTNTWSIYILALILVSFTLGCSTIGSRESREVRPARHIHQDAEAAARQSESSYLTEVPTETPLSGTPLTLDAALRLATVRNPLLIAKRKELGIAQGELRQASIYFQNNPELSVGADRLRVPSPTGSQQFTEFDVELSQEFEIFGQPRARRKAADAAREAVRADIAVTIWEVLADLRSQFYVAQIALRRVELAEEQFQFGSAVLELSRRQLDAGDIAPTEYRQLQIQMADLRTRQLSARADLASARDALRLSVGFTDDGFSIVDEIRPPTIPPLSAENFVQQVVEVHPRLRHARLITEQREGEYTLVKREGKPNITGSVFGGREDDDEEVFGIGLGIPLPLFNRNQGSKAAAKAAIDVARAETRYIEHSLRIQAQTAFKRFFISWEAASSYYYDVLPAVKTNLDHLENAFRQGEISMLELRINQRDLLDAQAAALDALEEYYDQRARMEGLLGRSFSGSLSTNSQPNEEASDVP